MEFGATLICRLCLKVCESGTELLEESTQEVLNFLALELDLGLSNEPVICDSCVHNLQTCFHFKATCLRIEHHTCLIDSKEFKQDIPRISQNEETHSADTTDFWDDNSFCYFCVQVVDHKSSVLVKNDDEDMLSRLQKYFPELDINIAKKSTICKICYESLHHYFTFINNCVSVEEKIRNYWDVEGTDCKGKVELCKVLDFMSKPELQAIDVCSTFNAVKTEEQLGQQESRIVEAKIKNENVVGIEETMLEIKDEAGIGMEEKDCDRYQDKEELPQSKVKCVASDTKTLKRTLKCSLCTYRTKYKDNLQEHILTHEVSDTTYKCSFCEYSTSTKYSLGRHLLIHNRRSNVAVYNCNSCTYQSKRRTDFQKHLLIHKSKSEVEVYKCGFCKFETKYKKCLKQHSLTHKDPSEMKMYSCDWCTYQTKRKGDLKMHILIHNDVSEARIYECDKCTYKAKHKFHLNRHMETHKGLLGTTPCNTETSANLASEKLKTSASTSELFRYKCNLCEYQAKVRYSLENHMLVHKSASEITMYKCDICAYQAKRKYYLLRHMLSHKPVSEVASYKCDRCMYHTKTKSNLKAHVLIHRKGLELDMYKCDMCKFQTTSKSFLTQHTIRHKNNLKLVASKSDICLDETEQRSDLTNSSNVLAYKCGTCIYQSNSKSHVRRHMKSKIFKCSGEIVVLRHSGLSSR